MIIEVEEKDVETLKAIAKRAILESVTAAPELKQEIIADTDAHIESYVSDNDHIFLKYVSEEGQKNEILGFILLRNAWNLSDLFIEPKEHGKGYGKELFLNVITKAVTVENRGYIRVNSSLNAEHFYRKLGFESFTPEKKFPDYVVPLIYHYSKNTI